MTVLLTEDHEGGSDGALVTTSLTGYSFLSGSRTFTNGWSSGGSLAMRIPDDATGYGRLDGIGSSTCSVQFYFRPAATPPTSNVILLFHTGTVNIASLYYRQTTGNLAALNASGGTISGSDIGAHALTSGQAVRIEAACQIGAGTGRLMYRVSEFDGEFDGSEMFTFDSGSDEALGSTSVDRAYFGSLNANNRDGVWDYDDVRVTDTFELLDGVHPAPASSTAWYVSDGAGGLIPMTMYVSDGA